MDERDRPPPNATRARILEVASRVLPARGLVLEIGSGTGQHVAHFATALPSLGFQPSELDTARHPSIRA
jgi:tRNA G46 methylase TrmB